MSDLLSVLVGGGARRRWRCAVPLCLSVAYSNLHILSGARLPTTPEAGAIGGVTMTARHRRIIARTVRALSRREDVVGATFLSVRRGRGKPL